MVVEASVVDWNDEVCVPVNTPSLKYLSHNGSLENKKILTLRIAESPLYIENECCRAIV